MPAIPSVDIFILFGVVGGLFAIFFDFASGAAALLSAFAFEFYVLFLAELAQITFIASNVAGVVAAWKLCRVVSADGDGELEPLVYASNVHVQAPPRKDDNGFGSPQHVVPPIMTNTALAVRSKGKTARIATTVALVAVSVAGVALFMVSMLITHQLSLGDDNGNNSGSMGWVGGMFFAASRVGCLAASMLAWFGTLPFVSELNKLRRQREGVQVVGSHGSFLPGASLVLAGKLLLFSVIAAWIAIEYIFIDKTTDGLDPTILRAGIISAVISYFLMSLTTLLISIGATATTRFVDLKLL